MKIKFNKEWGNLDEGMIAETTDSGDLIEEIAKALIEDSTAVIVEEKSPKKAVK